MNIESIIYFIGMAIAFGIGVYEYIKCEDKHNAQVFMIMPMMLLSWITVVLYFSNLFRTKKLN